MIRTSLLMIVLYLMIGVPIQAAGEPWWVWLYDDKGIMTQIDSSGSTLQQWFLPGVAGVTYSRTVAMSANGRYIAYSLTNDAGKVAVSIYDVGAGSVIYQQFLPDNSVTSLDFSASFMNFTPTNDQFAFGYLENFDMHHLVVIDITSGTSVTLSRAGAFVPVVQYHSGGIVQYTEILYAAGGAAYYPCKEWQVTTGIVSDCAGYIQLSTDTYALSEEVVLTLADTNFSGTETAEGMGYLQNTVKAYTPITGELFTVATLPDLLMARFIENGERIGVVANAGAVNSYLIHIMERSGVVSAALPVSLANPITSMAGIRNGFLFTTGSFDATGNTTLFVTETRSSADPTLVPVWNSLPGLHASIVWTSDIRPETSPVFAAWGRLDAPAAAATVAPAAAVLTVGGLARVNTTDGDQLNLRSGPGRAFQRVAQVSNGTIVTLIEGPISADGLTWWRIRLASGQEGWAVDFADGVPTLIAQ